MDQLNISDVLLELTWNARLLPTAAKAAECVRQLVVTQEQLVAKVNELEIENASGSQKADGALQWRPIETAPVEEPGLTGSILHCLVYDKHGDIYTARRIGGTWFLDGEFPSITSRREKYDLVPTHWMPLPPAPQTDQVKV